MPRIERVDHVITDPPYEDQAHTQRRRLRGDTVDGERIVKLAPLSFEPIGEELRLGVSTHIARLAARWSLVFCQVEAAMLWRDAIVVDGAAKYSLISGAK